METKLWNIKGDVVGKADLPDHVFGLKPSKDLLHEAVTAFLNNQRRWTAHTKTRAEVSGGGHKPWKQKHTGRARAGSNRSPLWRKGGVTFGPRQVDPIFKRMDMPRRKSSLALAHALSAQAARDKIKVLDGFALDGAKTGQVSQALKNLGGAKRPLVVVDQHDPKLAQASRNIQRVRLVLVSNLNAYEILRSDQVLMTQAALEKVKVRWN